MNDESSSEEFEPAWVIDHGVAQPRKVKEVKEVEE